MSASLLRFNDPVAYGGAVRLQEALVQARLDGRIADVFLLLQHRPVITLGRRGRREGLLVGETELAAHGIELEVASRGGDVTYHGPGQWVLYPILRLDRKTAGARGFLYRLEEVAIRTADSFGIPAYRRQGRAGAWTDHGKIAAIGFRVRRGITSHGMSLNVASDLGGFSRIVPCGLVGEPVASLAGILGAAAPSLDDVAQAMAKACSAVFERPLVEDQVPGRVDHPELARIVDGSLDCPDHPL